MSILHAVDATGKYHCFVGGVVRRRGEKPKAIVPALPDGFAEVAGPPPHGSCRWDAEAQAWGPPDPARLARASQAAPAERLAALEAEVAALKRRAP